jgi:FKBP-type peptidyl-prolyl cis-trans isomerase
MADKEEGVIDLIDSPMLSPISTPKSNTPNSFQLLTGVTINTPRPPKPFPEESESFTIHDYARHDEALSKTPGVRMPKISFQILRPMRGRNSHVRVGNIVRVEYKLYKTKCATVPVDVGKMCFIVGSGSVISGIEQGVIGMVHGEKRRIFIPPQLAFGESGFPGFISPFEGVVYDIVILKIK